MVQTSSLIKSQTPKIIAVVGPTSAGKSEFAQDLALQLNGEIINCDSQQFYRSLDIGTGKVLPAQQKVKHWLLDQCDPGEWMSAGKFVIAADHVIKQLTQIEKTPILVGGTGLYLRALLEGLDPLPKRDEKVRSQLNKEIQSEGLESLYQRLQKIDPVIATKINSNDSSRIIRNLEIFYLTGQAPSQLMTFEQKSSLRYQVKIHWLCPERARLRIKISERVSWMFKSGWVQEVKDLLQKYPAFLNWKAKPIGYEEVLAVLQSKISLEQAKTKIILLTQRYAKRQQTFFRSLLQKPIYSLDNIVEVHSL